MGFSTEATEALLPLGRRWPEGPDEGAFRCARLLPPHQFGRMTYDRAIEVSSLGGGSGRGRKSWPHVLSPRGEGSVEREP